KYDYKILANTINSGILYVWSTQQSFNQYVFNLNLPSYKIYDQVDTAFIVRKSFSSIINTTNKFNSAYIDLPIVKKFKPNYTIETWFKLNNSPIIANTNFIPLFALDSSQYILSAFSRFVDLHINLNNNVIVFSSFIDPTKVTQGSATFRMIATALEIDTFRISDWHHYALIGNGQTYSLVIDGKLVRTINTPLNAFINYNPTLNFNELISVNKQGGLSRNSATNNPGNYRDLRIWSNARRVSDINRYKYARISIDDSLLLNLSLTDNNQSSTNDTIKINTYLNNQSSWFSSLKYDTALLLVNNISKAVYNFEDSFQYIQGTYKFNLIDGDSIIADLSQTNLALPTSLKATLLDSSLYWYIKLPLGLNAGKIIVRNLLGTRKFPTFILSEKPYNVSYPIIDPVSNENSYVLPKIGINGDSNYRFTWDGNVPVGLNLNNVTGRISWSSFTSLSGNYRIKISNSYGSVSVPLIYYYKPIITYQYPDVTALANNTFYQTNQAIILDSGKATQFRYYFNQNYPQFEIDSLTGLVYAKNSIFTDSFTNDIEVKIVSNAPIPNNFNTYTLKYKSILPIDTVYLTKNPYFNGSASLDPTFTIDSSGFIALPKLKTSYIKNAGAYTAQVWFKIDTTNYNNDYDYNLIALQDLNNSIYFKVTL
ncbi:MAG: hypothetical protein ORN85_03675, partial [Sediminibacterium sp.]|nr:hypothetical protein [Sediminibacterium sp.]